MESDFYLHLDGVNGESQALDMKDHIQVEGWDFGGSCFTSMTGTGMSAGKPSFNDFCCSFAIDSGSFQIMKNLCKGTHIYQARFIGRKTGGDSLPYTYLKVTLSNCLVTYFHIEGCGMSLGARLRFAFERIEYKYYVQQVAGVTELAGSATYDTKKVSTS